MAAPSVQAPLSDWLAYLEQLHPDEIELGLDRMARVAAVLWDSAVAPAVTVVTVAGTNGKGSCIRAMEKLLLASDCSVGTYTSPHLVRFNERICVNGRALEDAVLVQALARVEAGRAQAGMALTFFEFTTLAALQCFRDLPLDYLLLEVGLGGRLDAVNLVDPDIAVITAIGLDHCDWLGPDRETIGAEKAGILRPGVAAVLADPDPPASVLAQVRRLGANGYRFGQDFAVHSSDQGWVWTGVDGTGKPVILDRLARPVLPEASVAAALQVLLLLDRLPDPERVERVLGGLVLAGRSQQLVWRDRTLLLDVAHNRQAVQALATTVRELGWEQHELVIVAGLLRDKPIDDTIAPLLHLEADWITVDSSGARRQSGVTLATALRGLGCRVEAAGLPMAGLEAACAATGAGGHILVFGSFSVIGALLNEQLDRIRDDHGGPQAL